MQRQLTIEKTSTVMMGNKQIAVASLPLTIRYEIETLDAFRAEEAKKAVEYEMHVLALKAKEAQVNKMLTDLEESNRKDND